MSELEDVERRRFGSALVVDVDRGVGGRGEGGREPGREADAVEHLQGPIVRAQAEADEAVDRRLPDRSFEGTVQGWDEQHREVVLLAELAETLDELAREGVRKDGGKARGDEDADRPAAAHREGAGGRVRRVAQLVRDAEDALQGRLAELFGDVESKRDRGLRDAGCDCHVSDGDPSHPGLTPNQLPHYPRSLNRFSKAA